MNGTMDRRSRSRTTSRLYFLPTAPPWSALCSLVGDTCFVVELRSDSRDDSARSLTATRTQRTDNCATGDLGDGVDLLWYDRCSLSLEFTAFVDANRDRVASPIHSGDRAFSLSRLAQNVAAQPA